MNKVTHPASGVSIFWVGLVCVCGPALVSLVPMAAAPAMPSLAVAFYPHGGGALFAQMVMTSPAIALILLAPLSGYLVEHFGRRRVLLVSLALYLVGGTGALVAPTAAWLIAMRLLLGVAAGGVLTSSLALIGLYFSGHTREKVLGFGVALSSIVAAFALAFGGHLVDLGGWRGPFYLYFLAIPEFLGAWLLIHPSALVAGEELDDAAAPLAWTPLLRLTPYFLLMMLFTVGMFTPSIQGPFLLQKEGVQSAELQGTIISACSLIACIFAAAFGYIRRVMSLEWMMILIAVTYAVGSIAISHLDGTRTAFGTGIIGIGAGLSEATIASAILMEAPHTVHGRAMGLLVSALFLGQWINPIVYVPLRAAYGLRGSFEAVGLGFAVLAVLLTVLFALRGHRGVPLSTTQAEH